jgi:WS/DGAT/MGAT family acyltransferase
MTVKNPIPGSLTPELVDRLAALSGQPPGVAEVALSAMRYGSLTSLMAHGVIEDFDPEDYSGQVIVVTDRGRELIEACAALRGGSGQADEPVPMTQSFGPAIPVPDRLTPELVERLANLAGEPDSVAAIALSALPYDALGSLIGHGIIQEIDLSSDEGHVIVVTDLGREIIAECAAARASEKPSNGKPITNGNGDSSVVFQGLDMTMVLGAVARFEGPAPSFDAVLDHVAAKLQSLPRAWQKLSPPIGPAQFWIDDSTFSLEYHVRQVALPEPGDQAALEHVAETIYSRPLDPNRPLWEVWHVEGLGDGGFAMISKVHAALLEGVTGVDLLTTLYDLTPYDSPRPRGEHAGDRASLVATLGSAALSALVTPVRVMTHPLHTFDQIWSTVGGLGRMALASRHRAPGSPLNVRIGGGRRVAFEGAPFEDVRAVKNAFEVSVNDVVLAVVAGALRSWMESRDLPVDGVELRALTVVGRGADFAGPLEKRIGLGFAPLPVGIADPVERLQRIGGDRQGTAAPAPPGGEPAPSAGGASMNASMPAVLRFISSIALSYNVMITNLPGARLPLYVLGRRLATLHPVGFLASSHALNIGAVSHDGGLYFGLVGDDKVVDDLDVIARSMGAALDELVTLAKERAVSRHVQLA